MVQMKINETFFDIEITGILGWAYDLYDTRIHRVERGTTMLSFSYHIKGDNDRKGRPIIRHENLSNQTEEEMVKKLWTVFDNSDILIAHNAYKFDIKVANAKFQQFGLLPPSPYKVVDTLRASRATIKVPSHSLQALCEFYEIPGKAAVTHHELWYACLNGDKKAWKLMQIYNDDDVKGLMGVYERQLPWIKNHPNMGDLTQTNGVCPNCAGSVRPYGSAPRRNGRVKAYICNDCGKRCNEATLKGDGRLVSA